MNQILSTVLWTAILAAAPLTVAVGAEPAQGESMTVRASTAEAEAEAEREAMRSRTCLSATGSRIRRADQNCMHRGRGYSREDIQRTGSVELGDALQRLSPSITRGR